MEKRVDFAVQTTGGMVLDVEIGVSALAELVESTSENLTDLVSETQRLKGQSAIFYMALGDKFSGYRFLDEEMTTDMHQSIERAAQCTTDYFELLLFAVPLVDRETFKNDRAADYRTLLSTGFFKDSAEFKSYAVIACNALAEERKE